MTAVRRRGVLELFGSAFFGEGFDNYLPATTSFKPPKRLSRRW